MCEDGCRDDDVWRGHESPLFTALISPVIHLEIQYLLLSSTFGLYLSSHKHLHRAAKPIKNTSLMIITNYLFTSAKSAKEKLHLYKYKIECV